MQQRAADTAPVHHQAAPVRGYTAASHPTHTPISTYAAKAVMNAVTNHAHRVNAQHAAHRMAAPNIRSFVHHQTDPYHGISPVLAQILQHMAAQQQAQPQPGQSMTWNGQQWVPIQNPGNGFQGQDMGTAAPGGPNGNNSIAANGGGNGILGLLMGLGS